MNVNKKIKDENLCIWKDLPQRFSGLGRGGPVFTGETWSFLQNVGFRPCDWKGRKVNLCPGDVSVDCHASPKHFQGIITLWFFPFTARITAAITLQCLRDCEEAKASTGSWPGALWGRVPALLVLSSDCGSWSQHHCGRHQKAVGYRDTDKALSSSRQQTSKKDVYQWLAAKGKREKISRDLRKVTEETFI